MKADAAVVIRLSRPAPTHRLSLPFFLDGKDIQAIPPFALFKPLQLVFGGRQARGRQFS